jgi:hypothetical protein
MTASSRELIKKSQALCVSSRECLVRSQRARPEGLRLFRRRAPHRLADLCLALGASSQDGSDLSDSDRHVLTKISEQLDRLAEHEGLTAARTAFNAVLAILAQSDDAPIRH